MWNSSIPGTAKLITPPNAYTSVGQTDANSSSSTPFFSTPAGIFVIALICFVSVVTLFGVSCAIRSCSKRKRLAQKERMMKTRTEGAAASVHRNAFAQEKTRRLYGEIKQQTHDLEMRLRQDAPSHVSHTHLPPPTDEERLRFATAGIARSAMREAPPKVPVSNMDLEEFEDVRL